jgi:hypothetical protein
MDTLQPKDKIGDSLNLSPLPSQVVTGRDVLPPADVVLTSSINQIDNDFEYARGNMINAIEKGQEALNGILEVAGMSQHPRAYEVAATLVKATVDASKDLMELSKRKKDLDKPVEGQAGGGPNRVTNNMFVGTTADLLKMLKQNQ